MMRTNINTVVEIKESIMLNYFLKELERDSLVYDLRPLPNKSYSEKLPLNYEEHECVFELAVDDHVVLVNLHLMLTNDKKEVHSMDIFASIDDLANVKEFGNKLGIILARTIDQEHEIHVSFNGYGEIVT